MQHLLLIITKLLLLEVPSYIVYSFTVGSYSYTFDNTLQSEDWNVIVTGLASAMNSDSIFAVDSLH